MLELVIEYLRAMDEAAWETASEDDLRREERAWVAVKAAWVADGGREDDPALFRYVRRIEQTFDWEV